MSAPPDPEGLVCVGALAGAYGVWGEARIKSFCAEPRAIEAYAPLVTRDGRSFGLKLTRALGDGFAARLTGVESREAAEALKGTRLYAPRERLPALGPDEFYHADLIGLRVQGPGGETLGQVRAIHDFGAGDVIEVMLAGAPRTVMLPFTRSAVPTVDLIRRVLVADPPPGLMPGHERDGETGQAGGSDAAGPAGGAADGPAGGPR